MRDWNEIEKMLGVTLLPWQREVLERLSSGEPMHLARGLLRRTTRRR